MTSAKDYIQSVFATVKARNGHEVEFSRRLKNSSVPWSLSLKTPEYINIEENILARITEPERDFFPCSLG